MMELEVMHRYLSPAAKRGRGCGDFSVLRLCGERGLSANPPTSTVRTKVTKISKVRVTTNELFNRRSWRIWLLFMLYRDALYALWHLWASLFSF